jgi:hypothetical protein
MKRTPTNPINVVMIIIAALAIGVATVLTPMKPPAAKPTGPDTSMNSDLSAMSNPMDAGTNAPWLSSAQIPVTGTRLDSFDAGANAPWLTSNQVPVTGNQSGSLDAGASAPWLQKSQSGNPNGENNRTRIAPESITTRQLSGGGR